MLICLLRGPLANQLTTTFKGRFKGMITFLTISRRKPKYLVTRYSVLTTNCWVGGDTENTYDNFDGSSKCSISKSGYGSGTALYADMFVYRYEE